VFETIPRCQAAPRCFAGANALAVHKAIQVAQALAAAKPIARMLDLAVGAPLLLLERTFLTRDGIPLEHAQIFCRPDRYRQIIEFRSSNTGTRFAGTRARLGAGACRHHRRPFHVVA
jgi:hypothetical protein